MPRGGVAVAAIQLSEPQPVWTSKPPAKPARRALWGPVPTGAGVKVEGNSAPIHDPQGRGVTGAP